MMEFLPQIRLNLGIRAFGARVRNQVRRREIVGHLPRRAIIVLANQRCGSTWLFDALRCHPAIKVQRSAAVYDALGLAGRRYPLGLSGGPAATCAIEVLSGQWEGIPKLVASEAKPLVSKAVLARPYAIEKCHPHLFGHDVNAFLRALGRIDRHRTVRMVYQVRDPRHSIISFLRYKQRDPSWHSYITPDRVPEHMCRAYESILRTAVRCPGLVVDYVGLVNEFHETIGGIMDYLWPGRTQPQNDSDARLTELMVQKTARKSRAVKGISFLGAAGASEATDQYQAYLARHAETLKRCYRAYSSLLRLSASCE